MPRWLKRVLLCLAWLFVWVLLVGLGAGLLQAHDKVWREQAVNQVAAGDRAAGGRWVRRHTVVFTILSNGSLLVLLGGGVLIFYLTRGKHKS